MVRNSSALTPRQYCAYNIRSPSVSLNFELARPHLNIHSAHGARTGRSAHACQAWFLTGHHAYVRRSSMDAIAAQFWVAHEWCKPFASVNAF